MVSSKKAAIEEDVLDRTLGEISGAELIQALGTMEDADGVKVLIADKKKYELWVDEGGLPKLKLREIIVRIRADKKKLELEPGPWLDTRVIDPVSIDAIAQRVEERLRAR